jgi:carboxyl-terminal processing protease
MSQLKPNLPIRRLLLAAGLCGLTATCVSGAPRAAESDAAEPIAAEVALASFDTLWVEVSRTYVDTAFVSSTWMAVRDTLRPRAMLVTRRRELDKLLSEALAHIRDSHFYLIPARVATEERPTGASEGNGSTGLVVRVAEDDVVAWKVEPGSAAEKAGITPGDRIARIGRKDADSAMRRLRQLPRVAQPRALLDMLHGLNGPLTPTVGDTVHVVVEAVAGKPVAHSLVAVPAGGRVTKFGNLPPIVGVVTAERLPMQSRDGCAGMIAFNIWLPELSGDVEQAVDKVRSCRGIIVDLRGNPGGVGAMVMGFGGYFVSSTLSLGKMRTRQVALDFVINPRGSRSDGTAAQPFAGPLAILVDAATASTSEIFATGMQRIGRARVFGEASAGAALPALMSRLPSGDVFVHAVADFTDPLGRRVEGAGVVPDEVVPLTVKGLKAGRDEAVDAAIRWITEQRGP